MVTAFLPGNTTEEELASVPEFLDNHLRWLVEKRACVVTFIPHEVHEEWAKIPVLIALAKSKQQEGREDENQ